MFNVAGLNSKKEFNKPFQNTPEQEQFLLNCLNFLNNLTVQSNKSGKNVTNSIKSIQGWKITINAVMQLWNFLHENGYRFPFNSKAQSRCSRKCIWLHTTTKCKLF